MKNQADKIKLNWFIKTLLRLRPKLAVKLLTRKMGIKASLFNQAHEVFSKTERIDIFPLKSGHRGFIIILDRNTALYFYQDGNHFIYDGYEIGEYDEGDITIFDNINIG